MKEPHPHIQKHFFDVLEEKEIIGFDQGVVEELIREESWDILQGVCAFLVQSLLDGEGIFLVIRRAALDPNCLDSEIAAFFFVLMEQGKAFHYAYFLSALLSLVLYRPNFGHAMYEACFGPCGTCSIHTVFGNSHIIL